MRREQVKILNLLSSAVIETKNKEWLYVELTAKSIAELALKLKEAEES